MNGPTDLVERLAAITQQRATNTQMLALSFSVGCRNRGRPLRLPRHYS